MDAVVTDKLSVIRDTDGAGGTLFAILNETGKQPTHALVINSSTSKLETWALESTTFTSPAKARAKKADATGSDDSDDGKKTEDAG